MVGPRERPRLWDRHLLNSAVLTELLPDGAQVVDVGSGAGLPGLALACARPDLRLTLLEPLDRRVRFLDLAVEVLALGAQVRVVRGRAEDGAVVQAVAPVAWVTARAVAPLDRLMRWCLPLLAVNGTLLALKGERAEAEIRQAGPILLKQRAYAQVQAVGAAILPSPVKVVVVRKGGNR